MNTEPNARLHEIVSQALAVLGPEREAFVNQACAGDAGLRARIADILAHDPGAAPPTRIAHFAIRGTLGEGGMGVVYLVQREQHPHDFKALKVIKPGLSSKEVLARFEAEQKAMAVLDHPSIVRFAEAGMTGDGQPYFAMELIRGESIIEYCDGNQIDLQGRLAIFADACDAIRHAHDKRIVHRDLKPSNILVAEVDGKPVPKIIDWGLAKALDYQLSHRTLFTEHGRWVGTPEYMAPELVGKGPTDPDPRADVYSLGVILYELIVGATPIDGKSLRGKAWEEMARVLREFRPDRPSTRKKTLLTRGAAGARVRGIDLHKLPRSRRDDIDEIALKALEKRPVHRFQSATELAESLRRHLRGERVFVGTIRNRWDRLRRLLEARRVACLTVVLAVILLAATGMAYTSTRKTRTVSRLAEESRLAFREERWLDCIQTADAALDLDPLHSQSLYAAAACRHQGVHPETELARAASSDLTDALALVDRCIADENEGYLDRCWSLRAAILLELDASRAAEAGVAITRAIQLAPDEFTLRIYECAAYALQGDLERAAIAAETGLAQVKRMGATGRMADELYRHLGAIRLQQGRIGEAGPLLETAHRLDPNDHRNDVTLARYYLEKDDPRQAYDKAVPTGDYKVPYYDRILALARLRFGQNREAIEAAMDERYGPDPIPAFRYLIVAIGHAKLNERSSAEQLLERARRWIQDDLNPQGHTVTFDNEFLWFDNPSELQSLLAEAEDAVRLIGRP